LLPYIQIHFNLTITRTVLMSAFCTVFIPYFPVRAYERDHRSHPQNEKNSKGGTRLHNRGVKDRTIESKTFVSSQTSFFDIFVREETTRIFREILVDIAQSAFEKSSPKRALTSASLQALTRQSIFFGGGALMPSWHVRSSGLLQHLSPLEVERDTTDITPNPSKRTAQAYAIRHYEGVLKKSSAIIQQKVLHWELTAHILPS